MKGNLHFVLLWLLAVFVFGLLAAKGILAPDRAIPALAVESVRDLLIAIISALLTLASTRKD